METKMWYDICNDELQVLFFEDLGQGRRSVVLPMEMKIQVLERGESVPGPSLQLGSYGNSLLKSLAEQLDKQGIKTDSDATIQGTLQATKYHLEDLRKLLKIEQ